MARLHWQDPRRKWQGDEPWLSFCARNLNKHSRLMSKDHWFWIAVGWLLFFWSPSQRRAFRDHFATTLGPIQAYPPGWSTYTVRKLLVHESAHVNQFQRAGFNLHPWLGLPGMLLAYVLLPLPIGLCYGRMRLEADALYAELKEGLQLGWYNLPTASARALRFAHTVSGRAYLWPWPRKWTERCFEKALNRALDETREQRFGGDAKD